MKPRVFVGCSVEGLAVARAIQSNLDHSADVELWNQGVFGLSTATLEALFEAIDRTDFAILVLTADDLRESRGERELVARDNVLFELGLFMGALGRGRTVFVFDRNRPPVLPSDLRGITPATFAKHVSGNLRASLGAACSAIQEKIDAAGLRPQPADVADGIDADRKYSKWRATWRFAESPKQNFWSAIYQGERIFTAQRPIPRFTWSLARRGDDDIPFTVDGLAPSITLVTAKRSQSGMCTLRDPRFKTSRLVFDVDFEPPLRANEECQLEFEIHIPVHKVATLQQALDRPLPNGKPAPGGGEFASLDVGHVVDEWIFEVLIPQRLGAQHFGIDVLAFGNSDHEELARIGQLNAFRHETIEIDGAPTTHLVIRRERPPRKRTYRIYWLPPRGEGRGLAT